MTSKRNPRASTIATTMLCGPPYKAHANQSVFSGIQGNRWSPRSRSQGVATTKTAARRLGDRVFKNASQKLRMKRSARQKLMMVQTADGFVYIFPSPRALEIRVNAYGNDHPDVAQTLLSYSTFLLYKDSNQAADCAKRAAEIYEVRQECKHDVIDIDTTRPI